jgi:hypothetical protein
VRDFQENAVEAVEYLEPSGAPPRLAPLLAREHLRELPLGSRDPNDQLLIAVLDREIANDLDDQAKRMRVEMIARARSDTHVVEALRGREPPSGWPHTFGIETLLRTLSWIGETPESDAFTSWLHAQPRTHPKRNTSAIVTYAGGQSAEIDRSPTHLGSSTVLTAPEVTSLHELLSRFAINTWHSASEVRSALGIDADTMLRWTGLIAPIVRKGAAFQGTRKDLSRVHGQELTPLWRIVEETRRQQIP